MAMAQTQHEIFKRKAADIFTFLDHDKDGNLKIEDLRKGFKKLGIPLTSHDIILEEIQLHHSPQNRNIVTKEEFEEYSEKQFEKVKDLFNKLDKQGDHLLTIDELMEGLREFEPHFKHDELEIKKLFKRVDHDNDGAIGFEEWCKFLILLPQANIKTVMKHWEVAVTISEQNEIPLLEFEEEKPDLIDSKMSSEVQKWINSFGAGLFAGIISRTTTAPLDRLKFIYQIYYKDHKRPPSIREGLRGIYRADGISGLFRGNLVNILKASPETSIRLTVFEKLKATLVSDETELSLKNLFIAGAASGVIANLAVFPMDVLRTRLAAAPSGTYFGVTDAITTIIRTEGIRSFYRGLQASLSASLPNAGLNLMSYEALKDIMVGKRPKAEPSPFTFMIVGGLSAMFSSTILYPFQVVTSRLIMQNLLEKGQKQGMFELGKRIWTKEGSFGFYKGYCPAISKIVIGNAISFSCFEFLKKSLSIDFRKH